MLELGFEAEVIYWRGPAPFFYAPVPAEHAGDIRRVSKLVSYGWGMIPVTATIGGVAFYTALFPKDDTYLLPLKADVRRKSNVTVGDVISIEMKIQSARA
ncbi:hypothetical protein VE25_10560 [Devosia geojensis]|uniref:DUF1905 domain-containing protein n=1 Tax=Devosia geojensis TaxID=443610 RepID=A0A0F5FT93_9HYPH|nr:DUF1905 domain-containing protein [Devosia geojensis]KKB11805.1 hypothetical protein VE25_10560 [Devosia geojensis]